MTQFQLDQLQNLIDKISGLENFFVHSFNRKHQLKMSTFAFNIFTGDKRVDLDLADYPEMCEDIILAMKKHLDMMKQALEDA